VVVKCQGEGACAAESDEMTQRRESLVPKSFSEEKGKFGDACDVTGLTRKRKMRVLDYRGIHNDTVTKIKLNTQLTISKINRQNGKRSRYGSAPHHIRLRKGCPRPHSFPLLGGGEGDGRRACAIYSHYSLRQLMGFEAPPHTRDVVRTNSTAFCDNQTFAGWSWTMMSRGGGGWLLEGD
jgi:hypothetical protein